MRKNSVKKAANLFVSGVFVLAISNLIVKIIGVMLKVPLTQLIGNTGMGYYNSAYDVYVWLYMVSTAGLPVAISMMISESRTNGNFREAKKIFKITLMLFIIVGLVGMSVMIFGSNLISKYFYKLDGVQLAICAIAPTLFFICVSSAIRGFFQGYQNMVPTAISEVIESLGKLCFGIAFAWWAMNNIPDSDPMKYAKAAAFTILGLTIGVALSLIFLIIRKATFNEELYNAQYRTEKSDTMPVRTGKQILKTLIVIAVPITISSSVMSFTTMLDGMIISNRLQMIGLSEKDVADILGYFKTQVVTFFNLPPVLIYPISGAIVPYLSSLRVSANKEKIHSLMNSAIRVASLIAIPCAFGMSVLSEPIIKLLFASTYVDTSAGLLSIQALAVFFVAMLAMTTSILQAHKFERKPIISMLAGGVVKLASSWILIGNKDIQIYGAPIGTLLCYITIVLFNFYFVAKYVGFIPDFKRVFVRPLIASIICAAAAFGSYNLLILALPSKLAVLLAIGVAGIVYLFTIFLIRAVTYDDIMLLPKGEKICSLFKKLRLLK